MNIRKLHHRSVTVDRFILTAVEIVIVHHNLETLTNKQTSYSVIETQEKIDFNWKEDILDFDDIYQKVCFCLLVSQIFS